MDNTGLYDRPKMQPDEHTMKEWDVEPVTADQVASGLGWAVYRWHAEQHELAALCVDESTAQKLADNLNEYLTDWL